MPHQLQIRGPQGAADLYMYGNHVYPCHLSGRVILSIQLLFINKLHNRYKYNINEFESKMCVLKVLITLISCKCNKIMWKLRQFMKIA